MKTVRITVLAGIVAALSLFAASGEPAFANTFTVNSTGDGTDATPGDMFCATAGAVCTLRAAIQEANALVGADIINFNINAASDPGCSVSTSVCTVTPGSVLPTIVQAVTIDGYTQPASVANTNPITQASNAAPKIELNGTNAGVGVNGLFINGGTSTVRGLIINRFGGSGIRIEIGDGNSIGGNFIGTDAAGLVDLGNTLDGIGITNTSGNNCIGGTFVASVCTPAPASRNIIAGNNRDGVAIASAPTPNFVKGNFIGLGKDGNIDLGNSGEGIHDTSPSNTIGGTEASNAGRNVISGNTSFGVLLDTGAVGNTLVQNNYVGTDKTGTLDRGNSSTGIATGGTSSGSIIGGAAAGQGNLVSGNDLYGISLSGNFMDEATGITGNKVGTNAAGTGSVPNSSHGVVLDSNNNAVGGTAGTTIGGACTGACNLIAFNGGDGISVFSGTGNGFRQNSIHDNGGLGIDLAPDGVTANDISATPPAPPHDADTGANNLQNFPELSNAVKRGSVTTVVFALRSAPSTAFTIEYFSSVACDGLGNGEGTTLIATNAVLTDTNGLFTFGTNLSFPVPVGQFITATATRNAAPFDTSEFSACTQVGPMVVDTNSALNLSTCQYIANDCSLLGAIDNANTGGGGDTIVFNIPPGGAQTIIPASPLPAITDDLIIDGTTQPGFAGTPIIELDGESVASSLAALRLTGGSSTVRGLVINRFGGAGIETSTHANTIVGNYIGTNVAGDAALGNLGDGIVIGGIDRCCNAIGGSVAIDRNVISGNGGRGILITGNATSNTASGNYIGTNAAGTGLLGNTSYGIEVNGNQNTIGGSNGTPSASCTGACNLISGNSAGGILVSGTDNNRVFGNYIGTDVAGTQDLGNLGTGVSTTGASTLTAIGDGSAGGRNVISGNGGDGVNLSGATNEASTVRGNFIGVNAAGSGARNNSSNGIATDTNNNVIGGSAGLTAGGPCTGDCNVVSGNAGVGIMIVGASTGVTVEGNYVGTNAVGSAAIGNIAGIRTGNTSGSANIGNVAGNVISGNLGSGVMLEGTGGNNNVLSNYIGVGPTGASAIGNQSHGVFIGSSTNYLAVNVVSGNNNSGVVIVFGTANTIEDNIIGLDVNSAIDLGNGANGVAIEGASSAGNFIGNGPGPENTIAGNGGVGIGLTGAGANNVVMGNNIGKFPDGSGYANGSHGISIVSTNDADIGHLTNNAQGNLIIGNAGDGVHITSGFGTLVGSNTIRDNAGDGVHVAGGADHRVARNAIERNTGLGIYLVGGMEDAYGVTAIDASPDSDTGANNLQNYPTLTLLSATTTVNVSGNLNSAANTGYTLEFFYGDACDFSLHGEGKRFLGEGAATTNGSGAATFGFSFPIPFDFFDVPQFVTATATDPFGSTSELSQCLQSQDDTDDDNDALLDALETACGSNPMDPFSSPERIDTAGDDDLDGAVNEALPATALPVDCDRDGFTGENETGTPLCIGTTAGSAGTRNDDAAFDPGDIVVNDGCPVVGVSEINCNDNLDTDGDGRINDGCLQAGVYSEAVFKIGTSQQDPCGNTGWPLEFVTTGLSANKFDLTDLARFVAPIRRLDKNPDEAGFDSRFDLVPGTSTAKFINLSDMAATITGATGFPPMLGVGVKALGGPACPYPP